MGTNEGEERLDPTFLSEEDRSRMEKLVEYFPVVAEQKIGLLTELEILILEIAAKAERRGMERMWAAIVNWYQQNVLSGKDVNVEGAVLEGLLTHMRVHHHQMPEQIDRILHRELEEIGSSTIPETLPEMPHWITLMREIREQYDTDEQTSP